MTKTTRAMALISASLFVAAFVGCSENAKPAKSAANEGPAPSSSAPPPPPALPPPSPSTASSDTPTAPPPKKVFVVELDASGTTLSDGVVIEVALDRMIFLRDSRMAPDCSNVQVTNLYMKSMGSICQVGFLPLEQGLKPGEQRDATWKVGSEQRSFKDKCLPAPKKADADDQDATFWRHAKAWLHENVLAMR